MVSRIPVLLAGIAVVAGGITLLIVGIATPAWSVAQSPETGARYEIGVFRVCYKIAGRHACFSSLELGAGGAFDAVKAMTVLGLLWACVAFLVSTLMLVLTFFGKFEISVLPLVVAGLAGGSFLFTIVGVIIWGAKIKKDIIDTDLGYSFTLSILGAIVQMAGGTVVFFGAMIRRPTS